MCGSPQYNIPAQPSYGEAMGDALKAQVDLLKGEGVFDEALIDLLPLEEAVRKRTAQTDTDVLRQTLLGSTETSEVSGTYDDQGRLVIGEKPNFTETPGRPRIDAIFVPDGTGKSGEIRNLRFSDPSTGKTLSSFNQSLSPSDLGITGNVNSYNFYSKIDKVFKDGMAGNYQNAFDNAKDQVQPTRVEGEPTPIYGRNESGKIITDTSKVGETDTVTISEGQKDGLIDLLGDTRNVEQTQRLSKIEQGGEFMRQNPEFKELYDQVQASGDTNNPFFGLSEAEAGRKVLTDAGGDSEKIKETFGIDNITIPEFGLIDSGRQSGFDEEGNFLGAAALAEDIAAGSTSRQRERDISDVERLSGRFQNIMEDYRPAAATGISDAKLLLTQQRENLTGLREATQADVDRDPTIKLGDMIQTGTGSDVITMPDKIGTRQATQDDVDLGLAANVGDVIQPFSLSGEAGLDRVAGADTDTLRAMLLSEAKKGLGEGLTEREQARIREGFKGQSTMMGRTFDQSAGIAEAEAQMKEDNLRRLQNLGIAQSQLGQEAGLQAGDIARTMSADQFNVATQMDAETKNEQLRQQGLANYIAAVGNLAAIEDQYTLDPFAAILGRGANDTLGAGQGVVGSASYGLQSGPQYLNPEAGLGYISQMAANNANIAAAQAAASGSTMGGLFQGLGSLGGGYLTAQTGGANKLINFCWVAREVYGPTNPSWLRFRLWMFSDSPDWFFKLYGQYGERFASWISDKPRIKSFIRKWMDSKIKE